MDSVGNVTLFFPVSEGEAHTIEIQKYICKTRSVSLMLKTRS